MQSARFAWRRSAPLILAPVTSADFITRRRPACRPGRAGVPAAALRIVVREVGGVDPAAGNVAAVSGDNNPKMPGAIRPARAASSGRRALAPPGALCWRPLFERAMRRVGQARPGDRGE